MEVHLTPELQTLIAEKLATGRYAGPEQIIVEALQTSVRIDQQRASALNALKKMIEDSSDEGAEARAWLRQQGEEIKGHA